MKEWSRITLDPAVMGGKACIRGLRVTVDIVVGLLEAEHSREEILTAYPYLEAEDIDQALAYAAEVWDREFEQDVLAGGLDRFADEAISDLDEGRCTSL